jgi:hypothetical protein
MDTIVNDNTILLEQAIQSYANAHYWQEKAFFIADKERQTFAVITLASKQHPFVQGSSVVVMARVIDGYVLIDEDITDRPLVKELVLAGIPREKIICVYNGETIPPHILHQIQQDNPTQRIESVE